jgi:hypothetical protein
VSRCRCASSCGFNHGAVSAAIAVQPGAVAEPRQHRGVGLLPRVAFRYVMPAHAGNDCALLHTWKAATAGSAQLRQAKCGAWQQGFGTISHVDAYQVRVDWLFRA